MLVNNFEAKYELKNYLDQIVPPHEGYADSETVRTFYRAAQEASDEGELSITIAEPVADEQAQSVLALTEQQHMPVTVRVYYELRDPAGGAVFVLPDKTAYPTRFARTYCAHCSCCDTHLSQTCTRAISPVVRVRGCRAWTRVPSAVPGRLNCSCPRTAPRWHLASCKISSA